MVLFSVSGKALMNSLDYVGAPAKQTRKGIGMPNTHASYPRVCTHATQTVHKCFTRNRRNCRQSFLF